MITPKDNLRTSLGPITSEDNLQVYLHLSNLQASPRFMFGQPISLTMLELPLSRDLDLDRYELLYASYKNASQINQIK